MCLFPCVLLCLFCSFLPRCVPSLPSSLCRRLFLYIPRHAIFYTFLNLGTLLLFSLANQAGARDKPVTMRSVSLRVRMTRGTSVAHVDHAKGLVLPPGAAESRRTPPSHVSCTWLVSNASRSPNVDRGTQPTPPTPSRDPLTVGGSPPPGAGGTSECQRDHARIFLVGC